MKALTSLLLAVLLVLSVFSVSAYKQGEFPNGDVNRDGKTKSRTQTSSSSTKSA